MFYDITRYLVKIIPKTMDKIVEGYNFVFKLKFTWSQADECIYVILALQDIWFKIIPKTMDELVEGYLLLTTLFD